jgi:hypothetical protein
VVHVYNPSTQLRQKDCEFKNSLDYTGRPCLKKKIIIIISIRKSDVKVGEYRVLERAQTNGGRGKSAPQTCVLG